jgi:predicted alpha/beta hydrolase family esterase
MANILIIHGTYGYPTENWIPWLKTELEQQGHTVQAPAFPTPDNQDLTSWLEVFDRYREFLDEGSILVGHSVGASFMLSALETMARPVKGCFFVAGFASMIPNTGNVGILLKTFVEKEFNWPTILDNAGTAYVFQSDNDPYVPVLVGGELARNLQVPITFVQGAGHFNEAAGYTKFPLLLEKILSVLAE